MIDQQSHWIFQWSSPGLEVASVKRRQLFLKGHHHQTTVGTHIRNLRIEFDVLNLKLGNDHYEQVTLFVPHSLCIIDLGKQGIHNPY